jgi:hypothetical protein
VRPRRAEYMSWCVTELASWCGVVLVRVLVGSGWFRMIEVRIVPNYSMMGGWMVLGESGCVGSNKGVY